VRDKIEYIIDLGKDLRFGDALKTEANRVRGCQSQVWLVAELDPPPAASPSGRQDAVIVKADQPPQAPL
jgi:cysteine desulfuration protein SufE